MRLIDLLPFAVIALLLLVVFGGRDPDFALDAIAVVRDGRVVQEHDVAGAFRSGWWDQAPSDSAATPDRLYRPIPLCWFILVDTLTEGTGAAQRAGVLLLHVLTAGARLALLLMLFRGFRYRRAVAFCGVLFASVHGMAAEAVVNVVGADEILCQLFVALAWLAFTAGRERRGPGGGKLWYGASLLAYALAMLSKESAIFLPVVLFLQAWLFPVLGDGIDEAAGAAPARGVRTRRVPAAGLSVLPFGLVLGGWALLRIRLFGRIANFEETGIYVGFLASERIASSLATLGSLYLPKLFWPFGLAPSPSHQDVPPPHGFFEPAVLIGALVWVLALTGAVLALRRRRPEGLLAVFGILAFLPASNLVVGIGAVAGFRFFYGPLLAIGAIAAAVVFRLWARRPPLGVAALALLAAWTAVGATGALRLAAAWQDQPTLAAYAYETSPSSVVALYSWLRDDVMRSRKGETTPDFGRWEREAAAFDAIEADLPRIPSSGELDEATRLVAYRLLSNRAAAFANWSQEPNAGEEGIRRVYAAQRLLARAQRYARGNDELIVELLLTHAKLDFLTLALGAPLRLVDEAQKEATLEAVAAALAAVKDVVDRDPEAIAPRLRITYHQTARDLGEARGDADAVRHHTQRAYELDPGNVDSAFQMVEQLAADGERERALEIATASLESGALSVPLAHAAAELARTARRPALRRRFLHAGILLQPRSYAEQELRAEMGRALAAEGG